MTRWTPARGGALGALLLSVLVVGATSPSATAASTEIGACTDGGPRPCVVSVLRNGTPIDASWDFAAFYSSPTPEDASKTVTFSAMKTDGSGFDLGFDSLTDTWQVTVDMGDIVPRVVTGAAQQTTVDRAGHLVTVTGHPVTVSGQCHDTVCPEWAADPDPLENGQWDGSFNFQVTDYGVWEDAASRNAMYGLDMFTNIASSSVPPQVGHDAATDSDYLFIELANRHFLEDGTTVVHGSLDVRIPNRFLHLAYGVPNPELMGSGSLAPTVSGPAAGSGTILVTQESGATRVQISGITFSHRVAKLRRGVLVPTRPRDLHARRSGTKVRLSFDPAHARGAKVTGYEVACRSASANHGIVTVVQMVTSRTRSPLVVKGLRRGTAYTCRVSAQSRAGGGPWSKPVRVGRR